MVYLQFIFIFDGKQGEVVTLLGVANKLVDGGGHRLNEFLGGVGGSDRDNLSDAMHSELFATAILGLRQSVGIEKYSHAWG